MSVQINGAIASVVVIPLPAGAQLLFRHFYGATLTAVHLQLKEAGWSESDRMIDPWPFVRDVSVPDSLSLAVAPDCC